MKTPDELLAAIARATARRESARAAQRDAIKAAVSAGVPITHIAEAADMSREYIYRLTRAD